MREALRYFEELSGRLVAGCRKAAQDGTTLYTPDGMGNYDALWTRDFAYMAEYAPQFIPDGDLRRAIDYLLAGQRGDGWIPDRVYADGKIEYAAGGFPTYAGLANLDNGAFLAILAGLYCDRLPEAEGRAAFAAWEAALDRGLAVLPRAQDGLIYNDPVEIHSPYGFTDIVGKSGELFMESLLYWRGCRVLATHSNSDTRARHYARRAQAVEAGLDKLWSEEQGGFLAATGDCRQLDVWGNAYAIYIDFPLGEKRERILEMLMNNADRYLYRGQVRHLFRGEYWQRLLLPEAGPAEQYQNGAYWATATGWVMWAIAQRNRPLAERIAAEVLADFQAHGAYECINEGYAKLDTYVVSATNVYGALQRLID